MSLNGNDLTIGANQISFDDTSIEVQRDDTIDINADGSLDFKVLANILRALNGSQIQTDTINETTTDAGVTVDGLLIKDGNVTPSGLTAGRVVFVDSDGTLTDDADLTFSDDTLTATKTVSTVKTAHQLSAHSIGAAYQTGYTANIIGAKNDWSI